MDDNNIPNGLVDQSNDPIRLNQIYWDTSIRQPFDYSHARLRTLCRVNFVGPDGTLSLEYPGGGRGIYGGDHGYSKAKDLISQDKEILRGEVLSDWQRRASWLESAINNCPQTPIANLMVSQTVLGVGSDGDQQAE